MRYSTLVHRGTATGIALSLVMLSGTNAHAQSYPTKPIKLISYPVNPGLGIAEPTRMNIIDIGRQFQGPKHNRCEKFMCR